VKSVPRESRDTLQVSDLRVSYNGRQAVKGISFVVPAGEVFGLLGPSGAGKTSVLMALTGVAGTEGEIRHAGELVSNLPARRRRFGHVYQEFRLFDWMNVWDNVAFPCRALGWDLSRIETSVKDVLLRVGLSDLHECRVRDLSGGERQRVALARALAFQPRALLLDEPFSHLDPPLCEELKLDLQRFLRETSIPVVLVTHDHREAFALCDRIGILIKGVLTQVGRPDDLLAHPVDLDTARLLGFSNSLDGQAMNDADETVEIRLDGINTVWRGRVPGGALRANGAVRIACRPERVQICLAERPTTNGFDTRVASVHASADSTVLTLDLGSDRSWTVRAPGRVSVSMGQSVTCYVSVDDLMVYPRSFS